MAKSQGTSNILVISALIYTLSSPLVSILYKTKTLYSGSGPGTHSFVASSQAPWIGCKEDPLPRPWRLKVEKWKIISTTLKEQIKTCHIVNFQTIEKLVEKRIRMIPCFWIFLFFFEVLILMSWESMKKIRFNVYNIHTIF